jgi:hypothetical protein
MSAVSTWPWGPPAATPALVAHAQGGLTLGPERGELAADFWSLGGVDVGRPSLCQHVLVPLSRTSLIRKTVCYPTS